MNDLTKRVLISIEAAQMAGEDDGKCLRYSLCMTSKYSRTLDNNQKMWLPVWKYVYVICTNLHILMTLHYAVLDSAGYRRSWWPARTKPGQ